MSLIRLSGTARKTWCSSRPGSTTSMRCGRSRRSHISFAASATFSRLLCFDKRGAGGGASDTVSLAELPTLEQWSDDVRTVMQAAGSKRAALLGLGAGGQMAMLFAATYRADFGVDPCRQRCKAPSRRRLSLGSARGSRCRFASSGSRSCGEPAVISTSSRRALLRMSASGAGTPASSDSPWARAQHEPLLLPGGKAISGNILSAIRVPTLHLAPNRRQFYPSRPRPLSR